MKAVVTISAAILLVVVLCLLLALPVMFLWNWLMPEICGFQTIGFWQAFWLSVLGHLLAGSSGISKK